MLIVLVVFSSVLVIPFFQELQDKVARKNYVIKQMEESAIKFDAQLMHDLQSEVRQLRREEASTENIIRDLNVWFCHKG